MKCKALNDKIASSWIEQNGACWRFEPMQKQWFTKKGHEWHKDQTRLAFHLIGQFIRETIGGASFDQTIRVERLLKDRLRFPTLQQD